MAKVFDNWNRLVRATLRREQLRVAGQSQERKSSGLVSAVPDSLQRTTNINAILQAADEIQAEDAHVARILCEQAYSMAQNLDPNSDGRGVLQFKTGLMSVIKQKLAKKDGGPIERSRDAQYLWDFYQRYKRKHRVDEIQREEQKLLESGTFSTDMDGLGLRSQETKKVFTTLRALVEVMDALSKDAEPDGVGKYIAEEMESSTSKTPVVDVDEKNDKESSTSKTPESLICLQDWLWSSSTDLQDSHIHGQQLEDMVDSLEKLEDEFSPEMKSCNDPMDEDWD